MVLTRPRALELAAAGALVPRWARPAGAAAFPSKPVSLIYLGTDEHVKHVRTLVAASKEPVDLLGRGRTS